MCTTAPGRAGSARFIFPVITIQERDIDAPDDDRVTRLNPLGDVHQVAPDDIPTRVVVVGLEGPRPLTRLRFERLIRSGGIRRVSVLQIRETLLCRVGVPALFVNALRVKSAGTVNAYDGTENVRLFEIYVQQIREVSLDVFNASPDSREISRPGGKATDLSKSSGRTMTRS